MNVLGITLSCDSLEKGLMPCTIGTLIPSFLARSTQSTYFRYGVAGYPEKHEESPNMEQDLYWLKKKVEAGTPYAISSRH